MRKQNTTHILALLILMMMTSGCATENISVINSLAVERTERLMESEADQGMSEEKRSMPADDIQMPCKILFVSNRDGDDEIFVTQTDGSNIQNLTNNSVTDKQPAWSPDGNKICFSRELENSSELFLMNKIGDDVRQITFSEAGFSLPSFSPDGKTIAFISEEKNLYLAGSYGSNLNKITTSYFGYHPPVWSPDSSQLVYSVAIDESVYDLFLVNHYPFSKDNGIDKSEDKEPVDVIKDMGTIMSNGDENYDPDWSPDGKQIAFSSDMDGDLEIYIMPSAISEDSEVIQITDNQDSIIDFAPAWSPDGERIAYVSTESGNFDIFVVDADGENKIQLTDDPDSDYAPVWSPDGKMIAFVSRRTGKRDIFLIQADGTNEQQLTDSEGESWWPQWLPGCVCP